MRFGAPRFEIILVHAAMAALLFLYFDGFFEIADGEWLKTPALLLAYEVCLFFLVLAVVVINQVVKRSRSSI